MTSTSTSTSTSRQLQRERTTMLLSPIDTSVANDEGSIVEEDENHHLDCYCHHDDDHDDDENVRKAMGTPSPQAVHEFETGRLCGSHRHRDDRDHDDDLDVDEESPDDDDDHHQQQTPTSKEEDHLEKGDGADFGTDKEAIDTPSTVHSSCSRSYEGDVTPSPSPEATVAGRNGDGLDGGGIGTNVSNASEVVSDAIAAQVLLRRGDPNARDEGVAVGVVGRDVTLPDLLEPEDEGENENENEYDDNSDMERQEKVGSSRTKSNGNSSNSHDKEEHTDTSHNPNPTNYHPHRIHRIRHSPSPRFGPERHILFHAESLGLKLARTADGLIRILSVTPYRSLSGDDHAYRVGTVREGDVVRSVAGVDLRFPIEKSVWKLVVGLMKVSPRPLEMVVAQELELEERVGEWESRNDDDRGDNDDDRGDNNDINDDNDNDDKLSRSNHGIKFVDVRRVYFLEHALGIKLHHDVEGYVRILSVASPSPEEWQQQQQQQQQPQVKEGSKKEQPQHTQTTSQPTRPQPHVTMPMQRQGTIYPGDYVLEVGGVWDLHQPISLHAWAVLVKFIRECRRPLCMLLAKRTSCSGGSSSSVGSSGNSGNSCASKVVNNDNVANGESKG